MVVRISRLISSQQDKFCLESEQVSFVFESMCRSKSYKQNNSYRLWINFLRYVNALVLRLRFNPRQISSARASTFQRVTFLTAISRQAKSKESL